MYRFVQRNNKKLLAIFAAFLMVVFILPSTFDGMGGQANPVMGTIGEEELHASEFQAAEQDWKLLTELRSTAGGGGPLGAFPLAYRLGPVAAGQIQDNPRLFLLLQREAQRMGVGVSADRVNDVITNEIQGPLPTDRQTQERVRRAITGLLLVEGAFDRAASVIKVTQQALRHELARRTQNVTVAAVELPAAAYAQRVPPPTTQQVQAQFEKFGSTEPRVDPKTNPFGFGYRFPNRVKLQYLSIPREDVRKTVEASRSEYEWEVESQKYYLQNQSQFPTTKPAEAEEAPFSLAGPTTAATRPSTTRAAATTRPFEEVRADAKARIVVPEVERKTTEIQSRVATIMAADYLAFRNAAGGATQPATAPVSSQGVPYHSYEYLQRLAQTIQRDFGVLPTVAAFDDKLRNQEELAALEHIGGTFGDDGQFAQYATTAAEAFVAPQRKDDAGVLSLFEPSRPLRDNAGNVYLFRLTAADPAHAPATPAEVADAIRADLTAAAAYEQAKADTAKLLEAAKQSGLKQAAQSAQRDVITVGPFPADVQGALPGLQLKEQAVRAFAEGAFKLLTLPAPREGGQRAALIELPKEGKVYVAELVDVTPRPQMAMLGPAAAAAEVERGLTQELQQLFQFEWFDYENAKKRLGYASAEPESAAPEPAAPRAPRRPMF